MKVHVCTGWSCKSKFSQYIIKRLENDTERFNYKKLEVIESPCMWGCKYWPNVKINNWEKQNKSDPAKVAQIVYKELTKKK